MQPLTRHHPQVYGLVNNLPANEVTWDVVTGISAGSINAGAIATYAVGDEKPMADYLLSTAQALKGSDVRFSSKAAANPHFTIMIHSQRTRLHVRVADSPPPPPPTCVEQIYRSWPLGALEGIISKTGIYDSSPILSFLESHLRNGTQDRKWVMMGVVIGVGGGTGNLLSGSDRSAFSHLPLRSPRPSYHQTRRRRHLVQHGQARDVERDESRRRHCCRHQSVVFYSWGL